MITGELLSRVDGLTRDKLYYLEAKGYINPRNFKVGTIQRRDYSEEDLRRVQLIWQYWCQGFPPRLAYEKAVTHEAT